MTDDAQTRPTLETLLERINAVAAALAEFRAEVNSKFDEVGTRLDRIDGMVHRTRGEMLEMRADINEFRAEFRAQFKQPA